MKRVLTSLCVLSLGIAGIATALAQSPAKPPAAEAAAPAGANNKDYLQVQAPRMETWRRKIADFNERAETKTTQAGQAAKADIEATWTALEKASAALAAAGAEGWEAAKASYEHAVTDMETMWAKHDPDKT